VFSFHFSHYNDQINNNQTMHKDTTTSPFINTKATKGKKSGTNASEFDPIVGFLNFVNRPWEVSHIKLSQALQMIRNPAYQTKELIHKIRNGQKELKGGLPAFLFAGEFTYARDKNITKAAGLLQVEFDKIHDPTERDYFFKILTSDPHILAVFSSPSNTGFKVLVRIKETTSKSEYKGLFLGFKDYLVQTYITLKDGENCKYFDTQINDISRKCFQSYDPNLFVNYQALIFDKPRHQEPEPDKIQKTPQAPGTQAQGQTGGIENETHLKNIIQKIILNTRDGEKHEALRGASFTIGGYVAGENLDTQKWIDILKNLQAQRGEASPETSYNTILSGIEKGQSQPLFFTQASTPGTQAQASENRTKRTPINNTQASEIRTNWTPIKDTPTPPQEPPPPQEPAHEIPTYGLPTAAQNIIKHYSNTFGTPQDLWTGTFFCAIATAIGGGAELHTKYINNPVFWFICVGASGGGKTEPAKQFFAPFHKLDINALNQWKSETNKYLEYKKLSKAEQKETEKVTPPPSCKQFVVGDITPEKLIEANNDNPKGILLLREEFMGFLKDIGRYNKSGEIEQLLSSFSQTPMVVNRKTTKSESDPGAVMIERPVINKYGGIQTGLINELSKDGRDVSGYLCRFLFIYPKKIKKPAYNLNTIDPMYKREYVDIIEKLLNYRNFAEPIKYTLSSNAHRLYENFFNHNARLINENNEKGNGVLASFYAKLDYYALRFALVFHCLKWALKGETGTEIQAETMQYSIDVCEYFRSTGMHVLQEIQGHNTREPDRKKLIEYLSSLGNNQSQISDILKISQQAVSKALK
jgi:hypothetical protein